jgi:hypothetical protein
LFLKSEFFDCIRNESPSKPPAMLVNTEDRGVTRRNETVLSPVVAREGATKETNMRVVSMALLIMAFAGGTTFAQNPPAGSTPNSPPASPDPAPVAPSNPSNQAQPQGHTGPTTTTTGGAPASSPQGDAPPGMQPHPQGVPEQTVDPKK